jgi:radical SAM protein with 4Fe4S-binding SPASM domain
MNLKNVFEREKEEYIKIVMKNRGQFKKLIIYGVGTVGKILYEILEDKNIHIDAFCVTESDFNKKEEYGLPVYSIGSLQEREDDVLFLIGSEYPTNIFMINNLKSCGISHYIDVPKYAKQFKNDRFYRPILEITPQIGCPINCRYCPQELFCKCYFQDHSIKNLSIENFKICVDKTPKNLIIEFAGFVEPFLNNDLVEMLQYTYKAGRDMALFTTLVGLTREKFARIKNLPFHDVVLHLPDKDGLANIPMTQEYFELLEDVLNAKRVDGRPFVDRANSQSVVHPVIKNKLKSRLLVSEEMTDRAGNLNDNDNITIKKQNTHLNKIYCNQCENLNHNILLPDGSVVLCSMDFGLQHVLGNLLNNSYEEIINSEEMQYIKEKMIDENDRKILCKKCTEAVNIL